MLLFRCPTEILAWKSKFQIWESSLLKDVSRLENILRIWRHFVYIPGLQFFVRFWGQCFKFELSQSRQACWWNFTWNRRPLNYLHTYFYKKWKTLIFTWNRHQCFSRWFRNRLWLQFNRFRLFFRVVWKFKVSQGIHRGQVHFNHFIFYVKSFLADLHSFISAISMAASKSQHFSNSSKSGKYETLASNIVPEYKNAADRWSSHIVTVFTKNSVNSQATKNVFTSFTADKIWQFSGDQAIGMYTYNSHETYLTEIVYFIIGKHL